MGYQNRFNSAFKCISVIEDSETNIKLKKFCDLSKIKFYSNSKIFRSSNRIIGTGHLNEAGNAELAHFIYQSVFENMNN